MNRARQGVTLLELLIAVSLLSLLSVGILLAMRVGLGSMEKANAKLLDNRRVFAAQRILEQQIAGFMPVQADCFSQPGQPPKRIPFFQGEPESMRFVSTYSLQEAWRGYPRILEFQVIPGARNLGVRLVVNEILYSGPRSAGATCAGVAPDPALGLPLPQFFPIVQSPQSFVLADRLASCRFLFQEPARMAVPARWTPRWVLAEWPAAIRVELEPLDRDPSRLGLMSVTAPVRVDRPATLGVVDE